LLVLAAGTLSCRPRESPQLTFDHANLAFLHGDLQQAQDEAEHGFEKYRNSNPQWAWKFKTLEAKAELAQGLFEDVLKLLKSEPLPPNDSELGVSTLALIGAANVQIHNFTAAESALSKAAESCENAAAVVGCGDLLQARGLLASETAKSASAERYYELSLAFARSHQDTYLESTSLLNLGAEFLSQGRFDEAIDRSNEGYAAAGKVDAKVVQLVTQGNVGWAYYRLGDSETALEFSTLAEKAAAERGDFFDQENLLTNLGYIDMDRQKFDLAADSFRRSLEIAKNIKAEQDVYNALRVLARLALQMGDANKANDYAEQAREIARKSGNHVDELYPMLVQGQVAARRGDAAKAQQTFGAIEHDPGCPVFLKWEAQHAFAQLYEGEKQPDAADREYREALATFEAARSSVRREDFQLSFLTNASRIYDDYIHFLVAGGKNDDALRWAEYSRARTLSEGLGVLSKVSSKSGSPGPPALNPREIARQAKGVLLFYWLGEKQSYLWAITPQKTTLFTLPPGSEIEAAVRRYRAALTGPQDILSGEDGRALYHMLIAPAESLLAKDAKVFILPDGALHSLNFETLVVPSPTPHYWIEDADVVNSSSLRVLAASLTRKETRSRKLLLMGDSVAASKDYPELPKAADQMASVEKYFPAEQRVYQREQATPTAYLQGHPEQYSDIHFVAHGTASRLSPLDSAIVLSKEAGNPDSFKLYARDIIQHHLQADLVTISACYGSGEREYSGEGLVGLAWAFLRAGAHNVIAALWEVTDASTDQLMERFYAELATGATPDAALRAAKLSLLRTTSFHNPFYWAPFQLYTG